MILSTDFAISNRHIHCPNTLLAICSLLVFIILIQMFKRHILCLKLGNSVVLQLGINPEEFPSMSSQSLVLFFPVQPLYLSSIKYSVLAYSSAYPHPHRYGDCKESH